jgi:hypothetical protein
MGWEWKECGITTFGADQPEQCWHTPEGKWPANLPPLTLDWLHECEEKLSGVQYGKYCTCLLSVFYSSHNDVASLIMQYRGAMHATKEQRLEALCRTLFPERFAQPEVRK